MMRAPPAETIPGGSPPVSAGGRPRSLRAPEVPVRPLSGSQQQLASLTARVSESPLGPLSRERLGAPLSGEAEAAVSATLPLPYRPSLEGDLLMYNAANASARLPTAMGSSFISKLLSPSAVTAVTTPAAPMIPGSRVRCMPWSCLSEAATDGRPGGLYCPHILPYLHIQHAPSRSESSNGRGHGYPQSGHCTTCQLIHLQ